MRLLLILLVIVHFIVIIGNTCAFFYLPFVVDWYLALPLCSFIFFISLAPGKTCPLTRLENKLRRKCGLPTINAFIKHYAFRHTDV